MDSIESFPLTSLLRISWLAATLPILAASVPLKPLSPLRRLLSAFAARGKTQNPNPRKLLTVPQRFFLHFYVVAVAITTVLLVCTWSYAYSEMLPLAAESLGLADVTSNLAGGSRILFGKGRGIASVAEKLRVWRSVFVLVLMEVQVMRRLYETRVVFDYGPSARMHLLGYFSGLFFYTAAPLSLASACALEVLSYAGGHIAEFIVKGRERMPVMEFSWWDLLKPLISLGWCQWIGSAIFIWGWIHQLRCHAILISEFEQVERLADQGVRAYNLDDTWSLFRDISNRCRSVLQRARVICPVPPRPPVRFVYTRQRRHLRLTDTSADVEPSQCRDDNTLAVVTQPYTQPDPEIVHARRGGERDRGKKQKRGPRMLSCLR